MSSEFDSAEEVQDNTRRMWMIIAVVVVAMVAGLALFGQNRAPGSQVVVRHILIQCDFYDPADRARALDLIQELRRRIVDGGEDFAEIARDYSTDPGSASRGGILPGAAPGTYADAFDEYCWTGEIGEVSDVIRTSYGFHIIEILRRDVSGVDQYEEEIEQRALEQRQSSSGESPDDSTDTPNEDASTEE